ncbi:unnamed protein product [Musa acuminata subsp. malaccensis]|uniref:(wild Malaysian banana) hypothetical protein n=1 Tax=Musa acuminata subsp. malaccensis TaxID=214687 RepID=A0A804JK65_MUSAM|nr:unnamed protein product [Musa acuminata subsp. malaccensis]
MPQVTGKTKGRLMRKKENDLHQEDDSITSSSLSKENLNANQEGKEI